MTTPFIGQICMFGGNFAPRGWAFCQGQILSIAQNTALYSILGTTYGGNGQTTFGLPDLRYRVPVGTGTVTGLGSMTMGQMGGEVNHTLISTEMPAHNHALQIPTTSGDSTAKNPNGNILGGTASPTYAAANTANGQIGGAAIGIAGGSQPHNIMQPYLGLNFIIAMEGVYPSRN